MTYRQPCQHARATPRLTATIDTDHVTIDLGAIDHAARLLLDDVTAGECPYRDDNASEAFLITVRVVRCYLAAAAARR